MRIRFIFLFALLCCVSTYGQENLWERVGERYDVADYEGMKSLLDDATLKTKSDTANWCIWMGEYYYWLSYEDESKGDVAERYFNEAIYLYKRFEKFERMREGRAYLHLGELEYVLGHYDTAIVRLDSALKAPPYNMGDYSEDPSPVYKGLGMCYAMEKDYKKAIDYLNRCDTGVSDAYSVVRMKGKVYAMQGDSIDKAKECYRSFVEKLRPIVRKRFRNLEGADRERWWMSVLPFIRDCWRMEGADPELLYDVALLTKGILLQDTVALKYKYMDVRKAMRNDEVAIEWMVYERDSVKRLGAVVMRKKGELKFVETGKVSEINEWVRKGSKMFGDTLYARKVWSEAMRKAIGNARKVYFAPDGVLNQIGIEYMMEDTTKQLYRLTSTRELIRRRGVNVRMDAAAVVGGMNYDAKIADNDNAVGNDSVAYKSLCGLKVRAQALAYARPECDSIISIRRNSGDTLIVWEDATEGAFRNVAGKYDVVHLSTHGYCHTNEMFDNSDFPRREAVDRTLSESGLLFSGVNCELKEHHKGWDGIVSAKELSLLDMDKVDLCVVSACEGAKGRVSADGTYGIQRGLKAAGVGGMVLSLWKVDDEASMLFMRYFYLGIESGMNVRDAFWQARSLLRRYERRQMRFHTATLSRRAVEKKVRCFDDPYFYNAFILIDVI